MTPCASQTHERNSLAEIMSVTCASYGLPRESWTALRCRYLWLTGRVNMRSVEVTIQNLIGSGMDPKTENNPYLGFIYTSFQERATKVRGALQAASGPNDTY